MARVREEAIDKRETEYQDEAGGEAARRSSEEEEGGQVPPGSKPVGQWSESTVTVQQRMYRLCVAHTLKRQL